MPGAIDRILRSPEIISEICLHLAPGKLRKTKCVTKDHGRQANRRALASLARVCHAFSVPALDVLWRALDDIVPVLSVLPPFQRLKCSDQYVLTRDITQSEWDRLQHYAQRVHELHSIAPAPSDIPSISPSVWNFLARWCAPEQGLLPRLKRIHSLVIAEADPGCILLFSPTLKHLCLMRGEPTKSTAWLGGIVAEVAQRAAFPSLKSLRVDCPKLLREPGGGPLSSRLAQLQKLDITLRVLVEVPFLHGLAALPNLRKLSLWMRVRALTGFRAPRGAFSSLRDVTLSADPLSLARFLRVTNPHALETLTLHIIDWSRCTEVEAIRHIRTALTRGVSPSTTRLNLTMEGDGPRVPALLEPALAFRWLTHVRITVDSYIPELAASGAELLALAAAWPRLVEFAFALEDSDWKNAVTRVPDAPTPRTLVRFVESLPRLRVLTLPYLALDGDSEDGVGVPDLEGLTPCCHGLRRLRVCCMPEALYDVALRRRFAVFVDRLFVHLEIPDDGFDGDPLGGGDYVEWRDIKEMIVTLRVGREHAQAMGRRREAAKSVDEFS